MPSDQPGVFDKTIEKTNAWLDDIEASMDWDDPQKAYAALRAVLHALRDRLPADEAVDLAAQMPMLIRGFFFEGWHPANKPRKYRHKEEFLEQIEKETRWLHGEELERTVTAVFAVLSSRIEGGETQQVRDMLPSDLRELWPQPAL
ncbi:MAG TPA: DUF2267 domain-containing protein [Gammaproteobacteria bacterium]